MPPASPPQGVASVGKLSVHLQSLEKIMKQVTICSLGASVLLKSMGVGAKIVCEK